AADDTVNLGDGLLNGLPSLIDVNGGGGNNSLNVIDSDFDGGETYQINWDRIAVPALFITATLSNVPKVGISAGDGSNNVMIQNTSGSLGNLRLIHVEFGPLGINTVTLDDSANTAAEQYTVTPGAVYMPYYLRDILEGYTENLTLKGGSG